MSLGFTPSLIDDCVFFCDDIIFMVYVVRMTQIFKMLLRKFKIQG